MRGHPLTSQPGAEPALHAALSRFSVALAQHGNPVRKMGGGGVREGGMEGRKDGGRKGWRKKRCCCFGHCIVCVCPLHTRMQRSKANSESCTAWRRGPAHASLSCPVQEHKPHHPDAPASPWHQHGYHTSGHEPSTSSKHVAEAEFPKYHVLRGVQEFSCFVGLFSRLHQAH